MKNEGLKYTVSIKTNGNVRPVFKFTFPDYPYFDSRQEATEKAIDQANLMYNVKMSLLLR